MMTEHVALWIDPPVGWMYEFPKIYYPNKDGDISEWLVTNGYPRERIEPTTACRFWPATEREQKENGHGPVDEPSS